MSDDDRAALAETITRAIYRHAQGNPEHLAAEIIAAIEADGFRIDKPDLIPIRYNPGESPALAGINPQGRRQRAGTLGAKRRGQPRPSGEEPLRRRDDRRIPLREQGCP